MRGKLVISLKAIQENYKFLQQNTAGNCAAVIKADAYGLGMAPIAKALSEQGAKEFFVALAEEGAALRQILPEATIYILNGILPGEQVLFLSHNLIPVLNNPAQKTEWLNDKPCALHVDTGLNRLGFNANDFDYFDGLNVQLVMSHLACADTPDNQINQQQRARFITAANKYPLARKSLAASDGIFCGPNFHFDLVRPGAALYGLNPTPNSQNPMQSVIQLSVPVLQIRTIEQEGFVGYAATCRVNPGQRLATISLGYADGFFRSLSNQAQLYYKGTVLPVLGRVSMDVVTVDISALPENALNPGDMVDVFGPHQTPDELAKAAGTIGYEVLTSLGSRFERVYTS